MDYEAFIEQKIDDNSCFQEIRTVPIRSAEVEIVLENLWQIGGKRGWYFADSLWEIRGLIDSLLGGEGMRKGRSPSLKKGDQLDFWKIEYANKKERRLLLLAEMNLPGEAWLSFEIIDQPELTYLKQTNIFRPKNNWGRVYWYISLPFHKIIFAGMTQGIVKYRQ